MSSTPKKRLRLPKLTAERQQIKIRNGKDQSEKRNLKEFGIGWENIVVSRNMARDGQEMEDHSAMTPPPPLLLRRSDKKERMLLLAGIPLYGKPVEHQFMRYKHHPLKEPTYHQLEASAPKQ